MHKITLVCSAHRENGACNAAELLKILRVTEPDAIFVEWRPSEFEFYHRHGNVEAHAIAQYREYGLSQLFPVDQYDIPKDLLSEKRELDQLFMWVEQTSQEYRELMERRDDGVYEGGFKYLNSPTCATISERLSTIEDEAVNRTCDQRLILRLERWRQFNRERERGMMSNIHEHCRKNVFGTAVFLIGAAHKAGIVKQIEKYASTETAPISWRFYDGQGPKGT